MAPRERRIHGFLWAGTLIAIALPGLIWAAGYLYWQARISRGIAQLREDSRTLPPNEIQYRSDYWLPHARCRAIPALLREWQKALDRKDCTELTILCWAIVDAAKASHVSDVSQRTIIATSDTESTSLESFRYSHLKFEAWWASERVNYPPAWKWWSGRYRAP